MDKELVFINKNKTWELVDKERGQKVLDVKWVYTSKPHDTYTRKKQYSCSTYTGI